MVYQDKQEAAATGSIVMAEQEEGSSQENKNPE